MVSADNFHNRGKSNRGKGTKKVAPNVIRVSETTSAIRSSGLRQKMSDPKANDIAVKMTSMAMK